MNLFDCTLRDGANVVGNGFSRELTLSMIEGLIENGITEIEFGNAKGLGAAEALGAEAPLTDAEDRELAAPQTAPSTGLLGETVAASLCFPRRRPPSMAALSHTQVDRQASIRVCSHHEVWLMNRTREKRNPGYRMPESVYTAATPPLDFSYTP